MNKVVVPWAEAKAKADVLKALGNPVRLLVVEALRDAERSVQDLNQLVPVHQTTLSRHLDKLKKAGIVTERRLGPRVLYSLAAPVALRALGLAQEIVKSDHARRQRAVPA